MNGRPALVACDLDGTLFDEEGAPAPGIIDALAKLGAVGVRVVICTGRTVRATRVAAARLGLERGVAISYHGAVVVNLADGCWLRRLDLPQEAVGSVVRALHEAGATLTAYVDDERWIQESESVGAVGALPVEARVQTDLAVALEGLAVTRIIVTTRGDAGCEPLASVLDGLVSHWRELAVSPAPGGRVELHHSGADKRTALAALCLRLRVPASAVVACGDAAGDAGMLQWAGLGVAVAGGHESASSNADVVVARAEIAKLLMSFAGNDRKPHLR